MSNTTLVPIHLDGIYVPSGGIETTAPPVDFKKLDAIIQQKEKAYLGGNVTNQAFDIAQGDNLLSEGVHLHWSLPDALTKSMSLSLVSLQSFNNIFGISTATSIWKALQTAGWISPLPHYSNTAKIIEPSGRKVGELTQFNTQQINAINALLNRHLYPAAPNRWLVTRFKSGSTAPDKQWVLESDYVWEDKFKDDKGTMLSERYTPFPILPENGDDVIDYCFIGRWYELGQTVSKPGKTLAEPLTAVGFGEPTFAALYSNCRSVFGFQDPDPVQDGNYEVIGWFSDATLDYFNLFADDFLENHTGAYPYTQLLGAVKSEFQWLVPIHVKKEDFSDANYWGLIGKHNWLESIDGDSAVLSPVVQELANTLGVENNASEKKIRQTIESLVKQQLPSQSLYYAQCKVEGTATALPPTDQLTLAIGNTGSEALSALIGHQISPAKDKKSIIEDYLEAQLLSTSLRDKKTDLGPKFEEARHQKGFTAVPGGTIWTIRNQSSSNKKAGQSKAGEEITLPNVLANILNELNNVQQEYDQLHFEIETLQQQIFADWSTYLKLENANSNAASGGPDGPSNQDGPGGQNGFGGGGFGPGGQGGPGGGDQDGPGNQNNQNIDTHLPETLKKLRQYINWEIDVVLKAKIDRLNNTTIPRLNELNQELDEGLALFQLDDQYLQTSDINDWASFELAVKGLSLATFKALDFDHSQTVILHTINEKVLNDTNLWNQLNANSQKIAPEALELLKLKNTAQWLPEVYVRYNRLLLESLLPIIHQPRYTKQTTSAPRYWVPNEPSLLISGVKPSLRHGQDGRLRSDRLLSCSSIELTGTPADSGNYAKIAHSLAAIKQAEPDNFALYPSGNDWHPILMDWSINFSPAQIDANQSKPEDYQYPADYLAKHYQLPVNAVDFTKQLQGLDKISIPFSSRSILTPSGSQLQKNKVVQNLVGDILKAIRRNLNTPSVSKQAFVDWVNKGAPNDAALKALIAQPIYTETTDSQQIINWLTAHLQKNTDGKGLLNWYWNQLKTVIYPSPYILPDAPGTAMDNFINWVKGRIQLKRTFYADKQVPEEKQSDFELQYDKTLNFPGWLRSIIFYEISNYFKSVNLAVPSKDAEVEAYLARHFNQVIQWYQAFVRGMMHNVFNYHAYKTAYQLNGLSQAFGGFNKALSNLSQSYQLNIADPQASEQADKDFTTKVRGVIQQENGYSVISSGDYAPYRAGKMTLDRVRIIDTFGRYWPSGNEKLLKPASLISTELMAGDDGTNDVYLSPRLIQPMRLNFRWLSAHASLLNDDTIGQDLVEMNSHPATSPICGWVLPNNLDNSLMIYHHDGQALGYIDQAGHWRTFPSHAGPVTPEDIDNPHLSAMVQRLCRITQTQTSSATSFIEDFINVLDTAADSIAPDNSAQHDALSLLIGKPFALVRAVVSMAQKGLSTPFKRSDYNDLLFRHELDRFTEIAKKGPVPADGFKWNTYEYEQVRIPLRIGEYRQLNDGLAGYWIDEAPDDAVTPPLNSDVFYAPQSFNPDNAQPLLKTHDAKGNPFLMQLALTQDQPIQLSMLVDPSAKVHATCGILPVKDIHIPPDQYRPALNRMEVAFLTAPLLTLPERIHISLPTEPGYGWSWIEKEGQGWKVINSTGSIRLADFARVFPSQASEIWGQLQSKGWLRNIINGHAEIAPRDQRTEKLDKEFEPLLTVIEMMLESTQINSFDNNASFSGTPVIREGWLKLSKSISSTVDE